MTQFCGTQVLVGEGSKVNQAWMAGNSLLPVKYVALSTASFSLSKCVSVLMLEYYIHICLL